MPRSSFGPYGWPSAATNRRFGFFGSIGELGNLLRVAQAEVRPGLAGVGGLVDAVADGEVRTRQPFAAADVEDVRIGRRDGDPADRSGRLIVEDRLPRPAGVGGLPDAAVAPCRCRRCTAGSRWPAAAFVRPARCGPMLRHRISAKRLGLTPPFEDAAWRAGIEMLSVPTRANDRDAADKPRRNRMRRL